MTTKALQPAGMDIPLVNGDVGRTVVTDVNGEVVYILGGRNYRTIEKYDLHDCTHQFLPPLHHTRAYHASVFATDRRIYTTGGLSHANTTTTIHSTVEVYDPYMNVSTPLPNMPGAKAYHDIIEDHRGNLFVFGGVSETQSLDPSVYVYNKNTETWATCTPMPVAVLNYSWYLSTTNKLYIVGGAKHNIQASAQMFIYDIATDTWTEGQSMTHARYDAYSHYCTQSDSLYIFGGSTSTSNVTTTVECYDIRTNTWSLKSSMPIFQIGASCTYVRDTCILLVGGFGYRPDGKIETLRNVTGYDVITDTWYPLRMLKYPRIGHVSAKTLKGSVFIFGNMYQYQRYTYIDSFDVDKDQWLQRPVVSQSLASTYGHTVIYVPETLDIDTRIFHIGGVDKHGCVLDRVYMYSPKLGHYVEYPPLPVPIHQHDTFLDMDKGVLYIIGGLQKDGRLFDKVYAYPIADGTWYELDQKRIYHIFHDLLDVEREIDRLAIKRWNILAIDPFYKKMVSQLQLKS